MMTANKWVCSEDPRMPCTTPLEATGAKPGIEKKKKNDSHCCTSSLFK